MLLCLISCTNIIEDEIKPVEKTEIKSDKEDVQKNVQISGLLKLTGALPSEIVENLSLSGSYLSLPGFTGQARTAFPSIPTSGFTYEIKAVNTNDETDFYTGSPSEDLSSYTITIPATSTEKEYKIQASVRLSGFESEYIFLSGQSEEFPISLTSPVMTKDVTLKPLTGESGIMDLAVNVSGSGIRSAKATVNFSEYSHAYIQADMEDDILTFHTGTHTEDELEDGLSSGTWPVTFDFYESTDCTGEKAYSFTEVVNIFSNLATNTWVQNGAEPWFVTTGTGASKTTTCRITSAMVEGYALIDIFVDSSRSTSSGAANYTTESGSFINPCITFSKAIERLTDSTKDYTINITGTLTGAQTIPSTISAKTLTVYGSSESIYRLLQAAPLTIPVTYKNIIFEHGCADESPGGGGINNQGNLTIDNCTIQSSDGDVFNGGGVFNNGTLTLLSGTITGNTAQNGAGVYIEDGAQMTMSGGTISGNESGGSSGAVHVGTNSLFTMTGGTISGNKADVGEGGGLFIESPGTFIMSGGTISGNSAISGGAVYVEGTFKMKGSAYIPAGVGGETGSGKNDVYLPARTIKIAGKLTPPAACTDGIVATITPSSYTAGTQLIELDTGVTDTTLEEAAAHFAVTPDASNPGIPWRVSEEGKLIASIDAASLTTENYAAVTEITVSDGAGMKKLSDLNKNYSGKTIQLENDIVLPSGYSPIAAFIGIFNGNGKKISGLAGQTALFNTVGSGGTVKDLTVEGSSTIAGIAEKLGDGVIEGCTNLVNVTHTENDDNEAGGIVGLIRRSSGNPVVRNCVNKGTVKSVKGYVGGIAGREYDARCTIDSCVNTGMVEYTGDGYRIVGGIVGDAGGIVRNCINTGEVKGGTAIEAGGIAGSTSYYPTYGEKGIYNCVNLGSVSADYRAGGIAGNCKLSSSTDVNSTIKNCFNTGNITISDTSKTSRGGIAGEIETGIGTCTITNCRYYVPSGITINGVGKPNGVSVSISSTSYTDAASDMNTWVNSNNADSLYKTWTTKTINGKIVSVPDVGYEW